METILLGLPEILLCIGLAFLIPRIIFMKKSEITTGDVVEFEDRKEILCGAGDYAGREEHYKSPVISYSDKQGHSHKIKFSTSQRPKLNLGEKVSVMFDPASPGKAMLKSPSLLLKEPIVASLMGVALVAVKYIGA